MIRAIIFDCFGVLTSDGWLPYAEKYFSADPKLKQEAHDLNKRVDAGFLEYSDFLQEVADLAGIGVDDARKQIESNVACLPLFDYIAELKSQYKLGILSNAGANWLNDLFTPDQLGLFDAAVLSFEIGQVKPHPVMYHTICNKLNVQPHEAVFIDDIERYATGAKDIGMKAIWFKDTQQFKQELDMLLKTI